MYRWLVVVAACSSPTKPVAPVAPPPPPDAAPSVVVTEPDAAAPVAEGCVIRDANVRVATPLPLLVHGKRFALVPEASEIELRVTAAGAKARVVVGDATLNGDVDLKKLPLRPVKPSGWFTITSATAGTVTDDKLALDAKLPAGVTTAAPLNLASPCKQLTLAEPPPAPSDGVAAMLKASSKIALRAEPKKAVVATMESSDPAALSVRELARKDKLVKVRIGAASYVDVWIDEAMVVPSSTVHSVSMATPEGRSASARPDVVRCEREVGIYVRDPDTILVGTYKAGAPITRRAAKDDDVLVDLGGEPELAPFVRASALTGCH